MVLLHILYEKKVQSVSLWLLLVLSRTILLYRMNIMQDISSISP